MRGTAPARRVSIGRFPPTLAHAAMPDSATHDSSPASDRPPGPLEQQLRQANAELARLQRELATTQLALADARRAATAATEAKDRFLSAVSHELRTPLSAMILWTSLIEDQKVVDPEQLGEALDAIKRSAEEQRALIENLVETARLASGKLQLDRHPLELDALLHEVVESARDSARQKDVRLIEQFDPATGSYHGDRARLQQAIGQLVHNAIKFTPAGGRVTVEARRLDDAMLIRVADTGIGIAPEHLAQIFDRFMQVEHVRIRQEDGLGLGLSLVKQILELHGGTIAAHSEGPGRGASFVVHLPHAAPEVAVAPPDAHEARPRLAGKLNGLHVLVIEDASATRRALTAVLREAGAGVDAVDSAPAAWEIFERRRPDLIVSDLGLPSIDGYALLRQIRETEESRHQPHVPAIAVTAFSGHQVSDQAIESGFQTCLTKPVEPRDLVTALASLAHPK